MSRHIFFVSRPNGKGFSLFTVPGQMLTRRTPLRDNMMTHGCERVRRRYPAGTVFYTEADQVSFRQGCYAVSALLPLSLEDGTPLEASLFTDCILEEYKQITQP